MENLLQAKPVKLVVSHSNRQLLREALVVIFLNTIICSLVAVFVWLAFPAEENNSYFGNWVYSQSIGQTICIAYLILSRTLQLTEVRSKLPLFIGYPVIVFVGFVFGKNLAGYILSEPSAQATDGHLFWNTLLVTVFVSLFSVLFYSTWAHVTTLKMTATQQAARASEARLSMLQAQVEPHMLFNTLSNLRSLIDSDPQTAQVMLDHLVEFLRATLAGSMQDSASLKDEFVLLENYLSLMEIRMGDRLSFDLELPDELANVSVPVLILQPVVENAIKHGIEPTVEGGHISVNAWADGQAVAVEVTDTGVGYSTVDQSMSDGFGLKSVRDRLQSSDVQRDVLIIKSPLSEQQRGTSITVHLPMSTISTPKSTAS